METVLINKVIEKVVKQEFKAIGKRFGMTDMLKGYLLHEKTCGAIRRLTYNYFYLYRLECQGMGFMGFAEPSELVNFLLETNFDVESGMTKLNLTDAVEIAMDNKCRVEFNFSNNVMTVI